MRGNSHQAAVRRRPRDQSAVSEDDTAVDPAAVEWLTLHCQTFWLPTVGGAVRLANVRAHPRLAMSIIEGEHAPAPVLTEGRSRRRSRLGSEV